MKKQKTKIKKTKSKKTKFIPLSPSEAVLKTAQGLYAAGVMDAVTMHEFEALCLTPVKDMSPREIKQLF